MSDPTDDQTGDPTDATDAAGPGPTDDDPTDSLRGPPSPTAVRGLRRARPARPGRSERRPTTLGTGGVLRAPILFVVASVLVIGGLVDRVGTSAPPVSAGLVQPVPVAAPAGALSSSWFCAGATDGGTLAIPGSLTIANSGASAASGVATVVGSNGHNAEVSFNVQPDARTVVPETLPGGSPWVGAIVDVDAGAVAVSQSVDSSLGWSATPCATSGSSHWYFATGQTLINAGVDISLLNPYPTDSIVDLSFSTSEGIEGPEDFQGLDVPGGGLVTVDLGSHLRRRQAIAVTVTARTGSVVAWKTDWVKPPAPGAAILGTAAASNPLSDPSAPIPGVTVTLGAPSTGTRWTWPNGMAGNGIDEQYLIYNPTAATAQVKLSVGLAQGQAEPFDLTVDPFQVLPVISEQQARIPSGVAHSAVLESLNGVGVVAERIISADGSGAGASALYGLGEVFGGRVAAGRWLIPQALSNPDYAGDVSLYNPGSAPVTVSLYTLSGGTEAPLATKPQVVIGPLEQVVVPLTTGKQTLNQPILVSSTGLVYAESDFFGKPGTGGISYSFGVPLSP